MPFPAGEQAWTPAIKGFWDPFIALLRRKDQEVSKADVTTEKTDKVCPDCGKELVHQARAFRPLPGLLRVS